MSTSHTEPCPTCGKRPRDEMDARLASKESGIALEHYNYCPSCFHCLSICEAKALRERAEGREMTATVHSGQTRLRLRIQAGDMEELVFRYGFDIIERTEGMTVEALEEVERLRSLPYIETRFPEDHQGEAFRAWRDSLVIPDESMGTAGS